MTHTESQVLWSAANHLDISSSSVGTSDALAINAATVEASLALRADNQGTPASGDLMEFYILYSNGDVTGGEGSDTFDTAEQGTLLAVLDTNEDDPAGVTVPLPVTAAKSFRVYAVNRSSGRTIRAMARLMEKRSS